MYMLNMVTAYTPMQYTLWAEMIGVSTNNSEDESPTVPTFTGKQKTKEVGQ